MLPSPLVTIIIVCFNHEKYVEKCILSAINQTYKNKEIFVIDNGSEDTSDKIISKINEKYKFNYIKNKKTALTTSLNLVKNLVNGEYICTISADDFMHVERIEKLSPILNKNPRIAAVTSLIELIDESGNPIKRPHKNSQIFNFEDLFLGRYYFPAAGTIHRKEALDDVGWYNENYLLEDFYMWLKLTSAEWEIYLDSQYLCYYRRHAGNLTKKIQKIFEEKTKIIDIYKNHPLYHVAIEIANAEHFMTLSKGRKIDAIRQIRKLKIKNYTAKKIINGYTRLIIPHAILKLLKAE